MEQAVNRKDKDRISTELQTLNVTNSYRNRLLFSLWEDLAGDPQRRCCPFSGAGVGKPMTSCAQICLRRSR